MMAGVPKTTRKGPRAASVIGEVRRHVSLWHAQAKGKTFPLVAYQRRPVDFVRDWIGEDPLPHQAEIMQAVADSITAKVAVRSGQKTGKTKLVVWLTLWFAACFPDSRVYMTASTDEQIGRVLWKELRLTVKLARDRKGTDFGELPRNPATGVVLPGSGGEILGFTTRRIEAMAGLSGRYQLFVADEASALEAAMAEAIEGNTAGNARMIWISNPTRAEGPFYDCFFHKKRFWQTWHLSSEAFAKRYVEKGESPPPGMASMQTIERWREEWGEDSPFYLVRAKGDFVLDEQAKCISLHNIMQAQARWEELPEFGPLTIGIDPAGDKGEGDEYAFAVVRGYRVLALYTFRGLNEEAAIAHALAFIRQYRKGDETPSVNIDAEGPIGSSFYGRMRALSLHKQIHDPPNAFDCHGIKGSAAARRAPTLYDRVRDELWAALGEWMKLGGIPRDHKLEEELYAPGFEVTVPGKRKATHKDVLREKLGRSTDRADALGLAVWSPSPWVADEFHGLKVDPVSVDPETREGAPVDYQRDVMDPYAGAEGFDPYGRN